MANKPRKPTPAPVPRDHADASMSELMPFRSSKIKLWKSPLFLFLVTAAVVSVMMFGMIGQVVLQQNQQGFAAYQMFISLTIFMLLLMLQLGIYAYSRTDRPIWPFAISYAVVVAQLLVPGVFALYAFVFRTLLPGGIATPDGTPFLTAFISHFFGAGLCEELLKAAPMLIGAGLTFYALKKPDLREKGWFKLLHVRGPLDAVVMGAFAGAAFIMIETSMQYVPDTAIKASQQLGYGGGLAAGLLLLIPRVIGGASHIAYSMIFGYFIGLAVIRPKKKWQLIGIGWLVSSLVHGLWNSIAHLNPQLQYVIAVIGAVLAAAVLLKARQIDASEFGRENDTLGSIIVERAPAAPQPAPARQAAPAAAPPPAAAPRARPDNRPLVLDVDGLTIPLRGGGSLDLGAEPALGGRGSGVRGEIVPHPTKANVLGLRNSGETAWTARLRDGSQQMIEKGQNIRLAAGVQIDFGGALAGRVVAVG